MLPEQAVDQPLPNLENPQQLIEKWDDRPDSVGTAPYSREWELRVMNGTEMDDSNPNNPVLKRMKPTLFNNAHPNLIVTDELTADDQVTITNTSPSGQIQFRLPAMQQHVHIRLGKRHLVFPMHLEQIAVFGDDQKVLLSYRCCYRYRMVPMERRLATLYEGPMPTEVPRAYIEASQLESIK